MSLHGKNAIVTGGTMGLGAAIVREFLNQGANVLFCSRHAADGAKFLRGIRGKVQPGQKLFYKRCDVADPKDIQKLFKTALRVFKTLHILVNNAGIYGPIGRSEEVSYKDWIKALEINLYGTFLVCRTAIPILKKNKYGKIINLSGGGATAPLPRFSAYAASKAAVVRFTETLAEELREFHVDANAISPGALNTRFLGQVLKAGPKKAGKHFFGKSVKQAAEGGVPMEKGARLCAYLASPQSDGITGKLISAIWDPWEKLHLKKSELRTSDIFCLRRIVPQDRGKAWKA